MTDPVFPESKAKQPLEPIDMRISDQYSRDDLILVLNDAIDRVNELSTDNKWLNEMLVTVNKDLSELESKYEKHTHVYAYGDTQKPCYTTPPREDTIGQLPEPEKPYSTSVDNGSEPEGQQKHQDFTAEEYAGFAKKLAADYPLPPEQGFERYIKRLAANSSSYHTDDEPCRDSDRVAAILAAHKSAQAQAIADFAERVKARFRERQDEIMEAAGIAVLPEQFNADVELIDAELDQGEGNNE